MDAQRCGTGLDVSTKAKVGKEPFGDMNGTDCYGLLRNVKISYGNETIWYGAINVKACALRMINGLLRYK